MVQQDNYIGIAFGLDVTSLKAGLYETQKAIDKAAAEFKSATSGMDNWKDSVEGVTAELNFLNTKLDNQKRNINGYQAEIDELSKKYGENSVQVETYKGKLAKEQQAMAKTEQVIREKTSRLNMLEGAYVDTITDADQLQSALKKLSAIMKGQKKTVADYEAQLARAKDEHGENSEEVKELTSKLNKAKAAVNQTKSAHDAYASQLNKVESETNDVSTDTKKMSSALKDADSATVDLKGGFSVLKGAMADLVSNGIQAVISGIKGAITESREFRSEMSFLQATADKTGASFDQAQEKVKEVYSVLGETDSAVEGMNNLMTAGFDGKALDQITEQLMGASIQWHDTLKFEGLADGLQETLATGKAVGPFVELLERGGMVAEDFDEGLSKCKTDAEKQNYVLKQLSKLGLADVTKGYKESNKELVEGAEAQFEYEQAMANFGAKAEPVMTTFKKGIVDVLNAFMDLFKDVDLEGLKSKIEDAFKWFIDEGVPAIKKGIDFVVDNKDVILALIAGIGSGMAAWKVVTLIQSIVKATKAWMVATEGLTVAQRILNLVQKANPIGLVISAIAALIAIFVVLWNKCDWFREFWINLWEKIKEVAGTVWEAIKKFFTEAWDAIKKVWDVAVEWFKAIWEGIKAVFMGVVTFYATVYGTAWKMIKKAWSGVVNWFKDIWNKIKKIFSVVSTWYKQQFTTAWNGIKSAWANVKTWFANIWNGIKAVFSAVGTWFKQQFTTAWNNIKNAWATVKTWFSNIWNGIKNVFANVGSYFAEKFRTAWNNIKNAWASVTSFFSNIWGKIKGVFSSVGSTLGGYFKTAWNNVKNAWSNVTSFFSGIVTKIKNAFSGIKDKFLSIGKDMMNGIKEGITSKLEEVKKAATNVVSGVKDKIKSFLGINSPSKLMRDEVGKMMGEGIGVGLIDSTKGVLKDATKFTSKISNGLSSKMSDINAGLNSSAGLIQGNVKPAANVTNITNYNQTINSPKQLDRKTIYRQSKNLINSKKMSSGVPGGQ